MFTADQVWGLAIAADRINGGYLKEPVYDFEVDQRNPVKEANKAIVKRWLREQDFSAATAEDIDRGRVVRHYFNGFLLKELSGKINDFERQALKIAQKDEFTGRDMLDFSIVSCLPSVMLRDQARNELTREIRVSEQLAAKEGDAVVMDIEVISSRFNPEYNKHRVTARAGESFVDFWIGTELKGTHRIKAKVKRHRGDNTTQLNYVKIIG
jgi:hypothetical protein